MFYDERIHNAKGEALRKTVFLTEFLLVVYAVTHLIFNSSFGIFSFTSVATEVFSAIFGLILIVYGESRYGLRDIDEKQRSNKNTYYAKAFFWLLYFFVFVYCISMPFELLNQTKSFWAPNTLLLFLEIPCWLFLLLSLKNKNVPLNASFIQEDSKTYRTRVGMNILKFGGVCAGFTAASFVITLLYAILTQKGIDLITVALVTGILVSGLFAWMSFSIEYLLFSIAERVSDRAQEKNRISVIVLVFAVLTVLFNIAPAATGILASILYGSLNSVQAAMLISSVSMYFLWSACYFSGLFAVYLMSEIKNRVGKAFSKITFAYVIALISSYCFGIIFRFITLMLTVGKDDLDSEMRMLSMLASISGIVAIAFSVAVLIISILALRALRESGASKPWLFVYPVGIFLTSTVRPLFEQIFQRMFSDVTVTVFNVASILLYILFLVGFCSVYRSVNKEVRELTE